MLGIVGILYRSKRRHLSAMIMKPSKNHLLDPVTVVGIFYNLHLVREHPYYRIEEYQ